MKPPPPAPVKKRTVLVFTLGLLVGAGGALILSGLTAPTVPTDAVISPVAEPTRIAATNPDPFLADMGQGNKTGSGNGQKPPKAPKPPADPQARAALALVGTDQAAEQYWLATINNPGTPTDERKKLIEDLADVGYSNIKNPTVEDLQLIAYRLQLIDQLAQSPLDQTNAKALAEAQKDLTKTAQKAISQAQQ
jgi:hypothetical protein